MEDEIKKNKIDLEVISETIMEAKSAYNLWKTIYLSRSPDTVSEELLEKYLLVQNKFPDFFIRTERNAMIAFIVTILTAFKKDKDDK